MYWRITWDTFGLSNLLSVWFFLCVLFYEFNCNSKYYDYLFIPTVYLIEVKAYTCEAGRERDQFNEWKWVLPYTDPCECTRVIVGGLNTWTPISPLNLGQFYDELLLSNDIKEIREHYGLTCDEERKFYNKQPTLTPRWSMGYHGPNTLGAPARKRKDLFLSPVHVID